MLTMFGRATTVFPLAHCMSPLPHKQRGEVIAKWNVSTQSAGKERRSRGFFTVGIRSRRSSQPHAQQSCADGRASASDPSYKGTAPILDPWVGQRPSRRFMEAAMCHVDHANACL